MAKATSKKVTMWPIVLFLLVLITPPEAGKEISGFFLTPQRVFLLAMFFPIGNAIISGRMGKLLLCDKLMIAYSVWIVITLVVSEGLGRGIEGGGILASEACGAYFLGRLYVKNAVVYKKFVHIYTVIIVLLALFTIPEAVTGKHYLREVFSSPSYERIHGAKGTDFGDKRLGLTRACGPFPHAILYGTCCAIALGISWYTLTSGVSWSLRRLLIAFLVLVSTFASLSSGALMTISMQLVLIVWDKVTRFVRKRWKILGWSVVVLYLLIDVLSNRDPITVLISNLTFNPQTGYYRKAIWTYGSAEVWRHPLFGIGMGNWIRPWWMHSGSIDNFWLCTAVRHGIPGLLLILGVFIRICWKLIKADMGEYAMYRKGWITSMIGLSVAAITVHLWSSSFMIYCFMLGGAVWMFNNKKKPGTKLTSTIVYTKTG